MAFPRLRSLPASTRTFRRRVEPLTFGLFLGAGLGFHEHLLVLVPLGVAAFVLVTRARVRVVIGVLTLGVSLGVPWVVAPALAGAAWLLWPTSLDDPRPVVRELFRGVRAVRTVAALVVGAACGVIASVVLALQPPAGFLIHAGPPYPLWAVGVAIGLLAGVNAFGEEVIWRGALLSTQERWPVVALFAVQAASFGLAHIEGTPSGVVGVVVTALFSCLVLFVDRRWGLTASILIHAAADAVLFVEVYRLSIM